MAKQYDLVVIGAGAAGSTAASTANDDGRRVALIERDLLGGTCLNYGCDPTKTLLHVAQRLYEAQHGARYGLQIPSAVADWQAVRRWVDRVLERIRGGTPQEARRKLEERGIDLYLDEARFISAYEIEVAGETLRSTQFLIATGGTATIPPINGLKEAGFITNVGAVSLEELPRRLAIVGGGPVGLEFAQLFNRFGVQVTVLEGAQRILGKEDHHLADRLCGLLADEGIQIRAGVNVSAAECEAVPGGKRLTFGCNEAEQETLEVDEILLATGRRPVLDALHLEAAGVKSNKKGIVVDKMLRSNVAHIWAAGDVTGGLPFTHVASEQGELVARNAFADEPEPWDEPVIPWVTYTDPELAHVGQTEAELRDGGVAYNVAHLELAELDRAITQGDTRGMVKLLVDEAGQLLGGHILAPSAGDLLAPVVLAMRTGLPVTHLAETILPYPTMAEGVRWTADKLVNKTGKAGGSA